VLVDVVQSLLAAGATPSEGDDERVAAHPHCARLVFVPRRRPQVREADLDAALREFARRQRRSGS
jgi:hypothetical protein